MPKPPSLGRRSQSAAHTHTLQQVSTREGEHCILRILREALGWQSGFTPTTLPAGVGLVERHMCARVCTRVDVRDLQQRPGERRAPACPRLTSLPATPDPRELHSRGWEGAVTGADMGEDVLLKQRGLVR